MIELDEVDLAKALSRLAKLATRVAGDIVPETDSPERTLELAEVCEQTARLLRERAAKQMVIDLPVADVEDRRALAGGSGEPTSARPKIDAP